MGLFNTREAVAAGHAYARMKYAAIAQPIDPRLAAYIRDTRNCYPAIIRRARRSKALPALLAAVDTQEVAVRIGAEFPHLIDSLPPDLRPWGVRGAIIRQGRKEANRREARRIKALRREEAHYASL